MKILLTLAFMVLAMPVWACERLPDGKWLVQVNETLDDCKGYKKGDNFAIQFDLRPGKSFPPGTDGKCREGWKFWDTWAYASDGLCHSRSIPIQNDGTGATTIRESIADLFAKSGYKKMECRRAQTDEGKNVTSCIFEINP